MAKIFTFRDNRSSIILQIADVVMRFDLFHQNIDLLYIHKFSHQKAIKGQPMVKTISYDVQMLLPKARELMEYFSITPTQIGKVYRHDRNDRFVLLESNSENHWELDKELNGIKVRSIRMPGNMYKRKPDNYYRDSVIREYLRINHDHRRVFEAVIKSMPKFSHP